MLKINQIFDDKYKIIDIIGQGGMGTVYLAKNIKLDTLWAIKSIDKKNEDSFDLLAEPNILKKLNHHALPRIFDIIEDSQYIYIIEDYIEGVPLDKELKRLTNFDEKQVIEWTRQICHALNYLHTLKPNPIIYRDMKPQNLIISTDNKMKIIDFGIAREYKKEATDDTTYIGTRGYAAPEQYGTAQTDARTDIYSLGVTLYHMLTGKSPNEPPYEIKPVRDYNKSLSRGIEYIITKCTHQDPSKRYQTIDHLLKDLDNILKFDKDYKKKKLKREIVIGTFILSFCFLALLTQTGWSRLQQESINYYFGKIEQGVAHREEGRYDEAIESFQLAMLEKPDNPWAFQETALVYYDLGEFDAVITYINENIASYSTSIILSENSQILAVLNYIRGSAYFELGEYLMAVGYMDKAYAALDWDPAFTLNYAVSLARSEQLDEAEQVLDEARAKGMADDAIAYLSAEILFIKGDYHRAEAHYLDALRATEDEDVKRRSFIALSETYRLAGNEIEDSLDREINILERASRELYEKNNIIIIERLAEAYALKADNLDGAARNEYLYLSAQQFEFLLSTGYIRPYIMRNIAILYQNAGELDKAESALHKMIEYYPENYSAYMQMAFLCAEIESTKDNAYRDYSRTHEYYEAAKQHYEEAVRQGADDVQMKALEALIQELMAEKWIS